MSVDGQPGSPKIVQDAIKKGLPFIALREYGYPKAEKKHCYTLGLASHEQGILFPHNIRN